MVRCSARMRGIAPLQGAVAPAERLASRGFRWLISCLAAGSTISFKMIVYYIAKKVTRISVFIEPKKQFQALEA